MTKKNKNTVNVVYSTNPNFSYEFEGQEEQETLPPQQQKLKVRVEKKGRGGKSATTISDFVGTTADLEELAKTLKVKCGVGGSAKDGIIIMQGEITQKIVDTLTKLGYKAVKAGG
jgi:translation initiation factor 1